MEEWKRVIVAWESDERLGRGCVGGCSCVAVVTVRRGGEAVDFYGEAAECVSVNYVVLT